MRQSLFSFSLPHSREKTTVLGKLADPAPPQKPKKKCGENENHGDKNKFPHS
jgi:hypothetical protein